MQFPFINKLPVVLKDGTVGKSNATSVENKVDKCQLAREKQDWHIQCLQI